MVDLETFDAEGILLDCFEDDRPVLGLFAAGSGVLLSSLWLIVRHLV
jgi:hypothetical protein